jgi:enoyl-CoA hydratase/carnithine racemase
VAYETIIVEHKNRVAWIYLNRPDAMNAASTELMIELADALSKLRDDPEARVIVLSGKGRAFCAGADLKSSSSPEASAQFMTATEKTDALLYGMPKPVIAAVNGLAVGGGLEMAMMCDVIFADEKAKLGDAHSNFGVIPGGGSSYRLPKIIGLMRAKYIMFSGDFLTAQEMQAIGLVAKVTAAGQLEAETQAFAEKLAAKSPLGLRRMKELMNNSYDVASHVAFKLEKLEVRDHMRSEDAAEGARAFAEKRKPDFKGA